MRRREFILVLGGEWPRGGAQQNAMSVIGLIGGATCTGASWFERRQRVRAKRGPMINSVALLTMRGRVICGQIVSLRANSSTSLAL
jgi:hypothetical protein